MRWWMLDDLREAQDSREGFVDRPHFLGRELADDFSQSLYVDRADMLDEHTGVGTRDTNLGPK
jgi:hypothetical protein